MTTAHAWLLHQIGDAAAPHDELPLPHADGANDLRRLSLRAGAVRRELFAWRLAESPSAPLTSQVSGQPRGPGQFRSRLNAGALQGMELSPVSDNGDGQLSENEQNQHEAYATAFRAMTSR